MQRAACLAHQIKETCKFILDLGILLSIIIRICLFLFYLSNCVLSTVCLNVFPRVQFPYSFCESVSQVNFKVCLKTCLFTSGWFHKFSSCKSCKLALNTSRSVFSSFVLCGHYVTSIKRRERLPWCKKRQRLSLSTYVNRKSRQNFLTCEKIILFNKKY